MTGEHRITDTAQLHSAAVSLFGFYPTDSIVVLALTDSILTTGFRIDSEDGLDLPKTIGMLHHTRGVNGVIVLFYGKTFPEMTDAENDEALGHMIRFGLVGAIEPVRLLDAVRIKDGQWRRLHCSDPTCCSDYAPLSISTIELERIVEGEVTAGSRAEMVAQWSMLSDGDSDQEQAAFEAMAAIRNLDADEVVDTALAIAKRLCDTLSAGKRVPDVAVADVAAALVLKPARDYVWVALDNWLSPDLSELVRVARQLPEYARADLTFLTAWTFWRRGNTVLASALLDEIDTMQPDYSAAAVMLRRALEMQVDPAAVPKLHA